ncbi:MAG: LysM peptidoglycan-binding domain-containing protein [Clostridia bacterium]|nr:LysM peptidoglycan-binding domain-containing protein [Clostridia bacterium]
MNENTSLSVVSVTVRGSENIGLKDICYIDGKCPEQFGNTNSVIYADKYGPGFIFAFFEMSVAGSYAPELRSLIGMRMRMLHRSTDFAHSTGEGILNDINATINREIDKYCEYEKLQPGSISIFSKCIMVITGAKVFIDRTGDAGTYYFCTSERRILAKNRESFDLHRGDCFMICSSAVKKSMTPADLQKCLDSNKSAENNVSIVLGEASARDKIHDLTAITIKILNANVPNNSNTGFYQAVGAHSASQKGAVSRVIEDTMPQELVVEPTMTVEPVVEDLVDEVVEPEVAEEAVAVEVPATEEVQEEVADETISLDQINENVAKPNSFGDRNTFVFDFKEVDKETAPVPTVSLEDSTPKMTAVVPEVEEPDSYYDDSMQTQLTDLEDVNEDVVSEDALFEDEDEAKEQRSEKIITIILGVLAGIAVLACVLIIGSRMGFIGGDKATPAPTPTTPVYTDVPTAEPTSTPTPTPEPTATPEPTPEPTATPTPTPTPTPSPEELGYRWYTVKEGDTFWGIAYRELGNGDRWPEVAELNGMQNQALTPGTQLKVPLN